MSHPTSATEYVSLAKRVPAFTAVGRAALLERADKLRTDVLEPLRPLLIEPERDERDVAAFERAIAEIERLEALVASSVELAAPRTGRNAVVTPGALVEVRPHEGDLVSVRPVHPEEATIDDQRISWDSPLGRALLGARVGECVEVASPSGRWVGEVVRIRR
mgnify:FL=1